MAAEDSTASAKTGHLNLNGRLNVPWSGIQIQVVDTSGHFDLKIAHNSEHVLEITTLLTDLTRQEVDDAIEKLVFFRDRNSDFDTRRLTSLYRK